MHLVIYFDVRIVRSISVNFFFDSRGINYEINHKLVDGLVKMHVHKNSLNDHADLEVDLHKYFKGFTHILSRADMHILNNKKNLILLDVVC